MKSVMIAMPCYSAKVHFPTMRAILLDAINIIGRGDKFSMAEDIGNSDIAGSRGALFAAFVRSKADTLVFIDDDVFWEPGALIQLIDYPVDVVGGIYPKKQDPFEWPFKIAEKEEYRNDPETDCDRSEIYCRRRFLLQNLFGLRRRRLQTHKT